VKQLTISLNERDTEAENCLINFQLLKLRSKIQNTAALVEISTDTTSCLNTTAAARRIYHVYACVGRFSSSTALRRYLEVRTARLHRTKQKETIYFILSLMLAYETGRGDSLEGT